MDPARAGSELRDRNGIVLQTSGVEHELTVREALALYGSVYRHRRPVDELLDLVGLDHRADHRIGTLSGGERRRLDLALGIVGRPDVVFLDEPTTGFDPAARRKAWELVTGLCALGATVLLTTHYLDEAERLADRVGVLSNGRLVAEGTPDELIGGSTATRVSFAIDADHTPELHGVLPAEAEVDGGRVTFTTGTPTADLHRLTDWAVARRIDLHGLTVLRPSLEEVFLRLAVDADPPGEVRP